MITWTAPTMSSGQEMFVDFYIVQYSFGTESCMKETLETEFELLNLTSFTFTLFNIRANYQGRLGQEVFIGQTTSKYSVKGIQ